MILFRSAVLCCAGLAVMLGGAGIAPAQEAATQAPAVQQQPPQPQPPAAPQTTEKKQQQAAAKPATPAKEQPETGDGAVSIGVFYWLNPAYLTFKNGVQGATDYPSDLKFPFRNKATPGAMISLPAGKYNTLRVSYFRTQGSGSTIASKDVGFFSTDYDTGDYLNLSYTLQNAKISWDYLTWPAPPNSKFRLKTLWQIEATTVSSHFDAPYKVDSSGNAVAATAVGTNWFIYPMLGLGIEQIITRHLRFELQGSGFGLPHRSTVWDSEATLAYRRGQFEIDLGGRAFHFKSSPKRAEYVRDTLPGAYVGIRWYPKY